MSTSATNGTQSRNIFFETVHGKSIFVAEDLAASSKHMVIMSHGFRGDSTGPARQFVEFSLLLNAHGISTVRFDQPGSGNSEGRYVDSSFREWVATTSFLAHQYLQQGFQVAFMGQSMGASTSVVASADPKLHGRIAALLLWVPDPKSTVQVESETVYEEAGQQYRGRFWQEARSSNFDGCLAKFSGPIHLVYGEQDRYIAAKLRKELMAKVQAKGGEVMVLPGEDHSPWKFDTAQAVMQAELRVLQKAFEKMK